MERMLFLQCASGKFHGGSCTCEVLHTHMVIMSASVKILYHVAPSRNVCYGVK